MTKQRQNGFIAFSINREANKSETKPLPAAEVVRRAESMLGKTKAELAGINSSRDLPTGATMANRYQGKWIML